MKYTKLLPISIIALLFASCDNTGLNKNENMKNEEKTETSLERSNMDLTANPGDNFFEYANGGWMKNNPVPNDKTQYGSFTVLYDNNQEKLKSLVDELSTTESFDNEDARKISAIFKTGMDTASINKAAYGPIAENLKQIDALTNKNEIMDYVAQMHKAFTSPFFQPYASQDAKNSSMVILHIYQAGIGMPDRDYYLEDTERNLKLRADYVNLIKTEFILCDYTDENATEAAKEILALETILAKNALSRLELRDPFTRYNKMTIKELETLSPAIDWTSYFKNIGLADLKDLNVATTNYIKELSSVIENTNLDILKTYLKWNIINSAASYLSSDFEDAHFNFYGKSLSGQKEMKARWKRILNVTNGAVGEAVGKLYVEKYFPQEAKDRMIKLVENLRTSFEGRINNLEWMSKETKEKAIAKLAGITVKVGYPDKWKDYSNLELNKEASYFTNLKNASIFAFNEEIKKVGKEHDKLEWGMTPQTVNAYYSPNGNEIVFPAAILQAPFFDMNADDAVNYGGIGVVIGHEMTHGFDDQGRNYDLNGNLNNWWTEEDAEKFKVKTDILVNQFNKYTELDSLFIDGKLTLGENIADLGGLNISWNAYLMTDEAKANKNIDGFTPAQRFYLSYATLWRQNILDEELMRRLKEDVHSPGDARVNVTLFNLDHFYESFEIKEDNKLFVPKEERANIW